MVVLDDQDVAIDYSRVVHGEQRLTTTARSAPVTAWWRRRRSTPPAAVAGNDLLTARVDLATEDGEAVVHGHGSMLVARGA